MAARWQRRRFERTHSVCRNLYITHYASSERRHSICRNLYITHYASSERRHSICRTLYITHYASSERTHSIYKKKGQIELVLSWKTSDAPLQLSSHATYRSPLLGLFWDLQKRPPFKKRCHLAAFFPCHTYHIDSRMCSIYREHIIRMCSYL